MPKFPGDAHQMGRYINGVYFRGWRDFDTREEAKDAAKRIRESGIPARAITLGETHGMNYGMQAPERYIVYLPYEASWTVASAALERKGTIQPLVEAPKEAVPVPTKMKPIKITEEQDAAIDPLVKATGDKSFSDLVRRLLAQEAERVGAEWPDNMPSKEETMRRAQSKRWPKDE